MDWTTIISSLGAALLTGGGITGFFQIKETRRAKKLENDRSVANEWKELYERSEKKADELGAKLDRVYIELRQAQDGNNEWKVKYAQAQLLLCRKAPCMERDPPLGSFAATPLETVKKTI